MTNTRPRGLRIWYTTNLDILTHFYLRLTILERIIYICLYDAMTMCPRTMPPLDYMSPIDVFLNESSCTMCPLDDVSLWRCLPLTMCRFEDVSLGRCVPWTMRPLDNASVGRCVPWTKHPLPMCPGPLGHIQVVGYSQKLGLMWAPRVSFAHLTRPWTTPRMVSLRPI
jgi:hypothetical protein